MTTLARPAGRPWMAALAALALWPTAPRAADPPATHIAGASTPAPARAPAAADARIVAHLEAAGAALDPRVVRTLGEIDALGPRLLALRGYLRGEARIDERWSWTRAQIEAYQGSAEQAEVASAITSVRCTFELANPGYTLQVNPVVRSLEAQVRNWNANPSIRRAGERLLAVVRRDVAAPGFPRAGSPEGLRQFRGMLLRHAPEPVPPLAPPGLSLHGQMRAIDFLVQQRAGGVVAGPDTARVQSNWHEPGWTARLAAAVRAADVGLEGPLPRPDEPWHYEFREAAPRRSAAAQAQRPPGGVAAAGREDAAVCRAG